MCMSGARTPEVGAPLPSFSPAVPGRDMRRPDILNCAETAEPFGLQQSRQRLLVAPGKMLTRTTHPIFRRYTPSLDVV